MPLTTFIILLELGNNFGTYWCYDSLFKGISNKFVLNNTKRVPIKDFFKWLLVIFKKNMLYGAT